MTIDNLKSKWDNISEFNSINTNKSLRISNDCIPDLFIATDHEQYRYLLLYIPASIEVNLKESIKDKLEISFDKQKNIILIKLNDFNFIDLFNDLIISLYEKIKLIDNPSDYCNELIYSFYKWVDFFSDKFHSRLSNEEIKGLYGELFFLNEILQDCTVTNINDILNSWKGPYDTTNDFIFEQKNVEIKTKDETKFSVRISSEFQLEKEFDKELELLVISIKPDLIKGASIYDLINLIVIQIRRNLGDLTILYRALGQKGITIETSKEYNNSRFIVTKSLSFNCNDPAFPKLSFSNIPEEISKLSYILRIPPLTKFLIEEKKY